MKTQTVGVELFTQFAESENAGGWDSGFRFDGIIPVEDGRSGRVRIAWLNSVEVTPRWQIRGDIFAGRDFGGLAADGLSLETREETTYQASDRLRIGAQIFNNLNTTANFGSFNQQRHQIGPVARIRLTKKLRLEASTLFGVSRAAADVDLRIFAAYGF